MEVVKHKDSYNFEVYLGEYFLGLRNKIMKMKKINIHKSLGFVIFNIEK